MLSDFNGDANTANFFQLGGKGLRFVAQETEKLGSGIANGYVHVAGKAPKQMFSSLKELRANSPKPKPMAQGKASSFKNPTVKANVTPNRPMVPGGSFPSRRVKATAMPNPNFKPKKRFGFFSRNGISTDFFLASSRYQ